MIDKINTHVTDLYTDEDIENGVPWKDIVAVVRCKDCKHVETLMTPYCEKGHFFDGNPNWYCADGERR